MSVLWRTMPQCENKLVLSDGVNRIWKELIQEGEAFNSAVMPFFFSSQNRLTLHLNRKVSYNLEWIVLTWLLMDFLPVGTTSSLKLSSSHAVCNGEDASLFINLVVMQITASFFDSHGNYAILIKFLIKDQA